MERMLPNARPLPNGLVIIFEGIDGVGKTTQLQIARQALEKAGWPVFATRNMGGSPIGEALRKVLMSPLERPPLTDFYASLAIQQPLLDMIDEARKAGKIILMDRGPLSLAAYQIYGRDIEENMGWRYVTGSMDRIKPEAVILYEMDPETALLRNRKHPEKASYFESKPPDYFTKVARGFQTAAGRYPDTTTTINAAEPVETVQERTMAVISKLLNIPA
jgi:dTMP kinase